MLKCVLRGVGGFQYQLIKINWQMIILELPPTSLRDQGVKINFDWFVIICAAGPAMLYEC